MMRKGTISILGCGWYGGPLAKALIAEGYNVKGSTTKVEKLEVLKANGIEAFLVNLDKDTEIDTSFLDCELLVISVPPQTKKEKIRDFISQMSIVKIGAKNAGLKNILLISSIGVYQDCNCIVDETVNPEPVNETGKILLEVENLLLEEASFTTTVIRFGGLIGPNRDLAKHFAGKYNIPNGLAPINLIHLSDCIKLTQTIIENRAYGFIYNGVSPNHPNRKTFYTQACKDAGLDAPHFIEELLDWKQVDSYRIPEVLQYPWEIKF